MQKKTSVRNRTTQMDVGKQRNSKLYHIFAQRLCLSGTLEGYCECGGRRHGSDRCQIGRPVMSDYFQRISSGIGSGDQVKKCHPDKMADQDNGDHLEENRKLPGDRSLISQRAEGQSDKKWRNG